MKKLSNQKFSFAAGAALLLFAFIPSVIAQTLTHRYSFNDAIGSLTFADSVGGAAGNGNLVGTASLDGSRLQLDGVGGFATLPTTIISNYSQVSIEFWASFSTNNPVWTRVFAFGDQNGSGQQFTGLDYSHYAGGNYQNLRLVTTNGDVYVNNPAGLNGQTNVHVILVVDPVGNRMFYYNGTAIASNPGVNGGAVPALSGINVNFALIGKSLFDVDPLLEASISEFRIYQGVVSPSTVALNDAAGPDSYLTDPGTLLSVQLTSPNNPLVVNQNSQQIFKGNFSNVTNLN
ncbi:MAG: hypothetical protein M3Y82_04620, partial [Verrucomicrobiota bacterium]|nr:hypothetical protein [Verrucomicrobiota bacterium]